MIEKLLAEQTCEAVSKLYNMVLGVEQINIQKTNLQYRTTADYTIMVFPLVRFSKKSPDITAHEIGEHLLSIVDVIDYFTVVKGFLNIRIKDNYWLNYLLQHFEDIDFNNSQESSGSAQPILIEYSSPNTNKPLHLGHIRNNLIGESLSNILKANGNKVIKVNLVNDRGIHICKSMLAWQKWGNNETPDSSGTKGDKLVGKYYVEFDRNLKKEIEQLQNKGFSAEDALRLSPLMSEAQEMLIKWEDNDIDVRNLWKKMNEWVYSGFEKTYRDLGIFFDKTYYESETYLLGKSVIEAGLKKGTFYTKEDGSVWVDLSNEGLDEKLLLRSDGTSVYITQDLGTAEMRFNEFNPVQMIYVVGNEQNYHFEVLKKILKRLDYYWYDNIFHYSYGMVELPHGKMKSREGTVVDADDLIEEVINSAEVITKELGKSEDFNKEDAEKLYRKIGLGGLKYFILKVDPVKNMLFNPEESIDFNGNTGPFIQYTHARIKSLLRKSLRSENLSFDSTLSLNYLERELIQLNYEYKRILKHAAIELSPALIANFVYELAKQYNQFYQQIPVLKEQSQQLTDMRLALSKLTASVIKHSMGLLGIDVPEKM